MRKIISLLLALCLVVGMVPVAASATGSTPWKVVFDEESPQYYATFHDAFSAVQGNKDDPETVYTISLTEDAKESIAIKNDEHAVVNIESGVTLTNEDGKHTITVEQGGSLWITGSGTVDNVSHGKAALYNQGVCEVKEATLTRSKESAESTPQDGKKNSWYVVRNGDPSTAETASLTFKSGKVKSQGNFSSLIDNYAKLFIEDGTFSNGMIVVKNEETGTVDISGGTFEATYYSDTATAVSAFCNYGQAKISDGTFTSKGVAVYALEWDRDSKVEVTGGTFTGRTASFLLDRDSSSSNGATPGNDVIVTINGGDTVVNGDIKVNDSEGTPISEGDNGVKLIINGGKIAGNLITTAETAQIVVPENTAAEFEKTEASVAQVKETGACYASLQAAIDAAPAGATVTLLDNVALTDGIEIDKTITLDLNGKTISKASNGWAGDVSVDYLVAVKRGGNLTIEDSGDTGTIDANGLACGVKMTIKGETEDGKEAVLTVNGGTIQGDSFGISGNGTRHGTKITINGGTIKNTDDEGTAIFHPQNGELIVNGGTIKSSNNGIEIRSGTLTVTGGKISGGNGEPDSIVNGGGTTTSNAAVAIAQHTTKKLIKVNISGGTLAGGAALYESDPNKIYSDTTVDKPDIKVTGGTFTGAVSTENVSGFITGGNFSATDLDEYIADGYELVGGAVKEEQEPTPPPVIVPSNPTYANTVSDTENGKVTASPTRPKEGATVTITTTPDKGYEVGSVSVTDADGKAVAVTNAGNGKYTFKQPDSKVTIKVTFVWDNPFADVADNAWYRNAIQYVYENNLMAGTGDTTFDPEVSLTRAMTAQILYNLEGQPKVDEEATFSDMTEAPTWSVDAIAWAQDTGVVAGMGDNQFAPNAKVTREQFAQMMYNYAKYKKYDLTKTGDLSKFPDDGSVSDWAEVAMSWANGNGLINGHEDSGLIDPAGNTFRGQAASIIMNFDKNVVK